MEARLQAVVKGLAYHICPAAPLYFSCPHHTGTKLPVSLLSVLSLRPPKALPASRPCRARAFRTAREAKAQYSLGDAKHPGSRANNASIIAAGEISPNQLRYFMAVLSLKITQLLLEHRQPRYHNCLGF